MLSAYDLRGGRLVRLRREECRPGSLPAPRGLLWVDLLDPTREEEEAVEVLLGVQVPTQQEMAEIEESARLYEEQGALVLTAVVINGVAEGRPSRTQVTFVLTPDHLVTVRYADPVPFRSMEARLARQPEAHGSSDRLMASLLESIVERAADVLEGVAADLYEVSTRIFYDTDGAVPAPGQTHDLQTLIRRLGRKNLTVGILRGSLLSLGRLLPYLRQEGEAWLRDGVPARLKALERDVRSLQAYEVQLSSEITFLHDATLGLINLEQNQIIKVFSIAAVLFLPPTLVGTIYGMNFEAMPELKWAAGYPWALMLMVVSAVLPYWWFRRRGWL